MIKRLLFLSLTAIICLHASAQLRYSLKDTFTAYSPLAGATSMTGSTIWDDQTISMTLPFPWRIDRDMKVSTLNLILGLPGITVDNNLSDMNGFFLGDMDIADRGNLTNTASKSPIRYLVTGTAPKRILKVEFFNAGFIDELNLYQTMNDSFNMQVWIYEGSNVVEYHFGPSRVTYASDYYAFMGTGPFMGYMKHLDFSSGSSGAFYYVTDSRDMDSLILPGFVPFNKLSYWPSSGEVFRFTPTWTSCDKPTAAFTADTVIGLSAQYTYTGNQTGLDSLVWSFGDGTTLQVASNFYVPVSHVYTAAGRYNVGVTAYSDCGNDSAMNLQSAVGIRSAGGMGHVSVYPNPATSVLYVDGMDQTGMATVLSAVGQVVLRHTIEPGKAQLDIDYLPAGSYTLMLSDADGQIGIVHFVKQ